MAKYSSMAFQKLQPPPNATKLFFNAKLRPLTLCTRLNATTLTMSSFNSSTSNNHSSAAKRYLNCNVTTSTFPKLTTRCFHTVDTTDSEPWDYDDDDAANRRGYYSKSYALLSKGPRGTFVTKKSEEEGMYVRVDIPGVGIDGVKVWVENDSILCFQGKSLGVEYVGPRSYGGRFICCRDTYDLEEMKVSLKNGVLRIMIPNKKSSMASSNSLTKVGKLLLSSLSNVANTPTFDTNIGDDYEDDDDNDITCIEAENWTEKHPFQISGPRSTMVLKRLDEALFFLRLDMPGVGKKDLKVWVDGDAVFYKGKAPKESEHEDGRHYGGRIELAPGWCDKEEVRAEAKNGVIKITMPRKKF